MMEFDMFRKSVLTLSLLVPLSAISAAAHAGQTITDKSYWPNEAHPSVQARTFAQTDPNSAFAYDSLAYGPSRERGTGQSVPIRSYHGGPKFQ
jgi:hypothetical protein